MQQKMAYETGGGFAGCAGGGMSRGTGAFFSAGADFDLALAANARTKVRADAEERKNISIQREHSIQLRPFKCICSRSKGCASVLLVRRRRHAVLCV